MDSVSTILTTLDAAITAAGQRFFEATASAVGPIYSSLLALLLVMVGLAGGTFLLWNRDRKAILRYVWCWGILLFAVVSCAWCWGVSREYPEMLRIWMGDVTNRTDGNWSRSPVWYYAECLAWSMLPWKIATGSRIWSAKKIGERSR